MEKELLYVFFFNFKMSIKEMKDLNKRMYEKLVDVKYKINEENKKDEYSKRNQTMKQFTNVNL